MRYWLSESDCDLDTFVSVMDAARATDSGSDWTREHEAGIPIYDCADLRDRLVSDSGMRSLMEDWARIMADGSGIVVLKCAFEDTAVVDEATAVFDAIKAEERAAGMGGGDHFGTNDRIWNALEKLCLRAPDVFARYYGNELIALVSEAWLGPNYQMTSQTNLVHPGGVGQTAHRDYHLGFLGPAAAAQFPAAAHRFSPFLTLQGAVAHCDMPVDSGPTKFLPYSQHYEPGYIAGGLPQFAAYFDEEYVQLPLEKGDAVFFNPAVFHGAGDNRTPDVHRLANLLQVSSAMGRATEAVDRTAMCLALYPTLLSHYDRNEMSEAQVIAAVGACAEGYAFPTNLDRNPPTPDGLAPASQADIMLEALQRRKKFDAVAKELDAHAARQLTRDPV